ncbi:hypothetical protein CSUB01_05086 [Colletotrichum sublineola]|uniref:Uncharacterized protein n=1 Tax=Colletotrichum sublineola TaxID=1173701 RepID=A0A066X4J6_COLSU|nr:hypothetical protein CSUB01_05086 [Colletotrichum sublineola]
MSIGNGYQVSRVCASRVPASRCKRATGGPNFLTAKAVFLPIKPTIVNEAMAFGGEREAMSSTGRVTRPEEATSYCLCVVQRRCNRALPTQYGLRDHLAAHIHNKLECPATHSTQSTALVKQVEKAAPARGHWDWGMGGGGRSNVGPGQLSTSNGPSSGIGAALPDI